MGNFFNLTVLEGGRYLLMGVRAMNHLEITCKKDVDTVGFLRVLYVYPV